MNGLTRFLFLGARDADARVAAFLAPRASGAVDRYVMSSFVIRTFDRGTRLLQDWARASIAVRHAQSIDTRWRQRNWVERCEAIALVLLTAVITHVVLTTLNGPPPGWFWLILPGLAAALAVVLLAGSRTPPAP